MTDNKIRGRAYSKRDGSNPLGHARLKPFKMPTTTTLSAYI